MFLTERCRMVLCQAACSWMCLLVSSFLLDNGSAWCAGPVFFTKEKSYTGKRQYKNFLKNNLSLLVGMKNPSRGRTGWQDRVKTSLRYLVLFCVNVKLSGQVSAMMVSSLFSCGAVVIVFAYAGLTLSYGEEDDEIFHHHIPEVVCLRFLCYKDMIMWLPVYGFWGCFDSQGITVKEFLCQVNFPEEAMNKWKNE